MSRTLLGIPAASGIAIGTAYVVQWPSLDVPHAVVAPDGTDAEVERFRDACDGARRRTLELRATVEERLGPVQAKIFDPQLMILEDPDLIDATLTYIRESNLTAERAFSLRVLEFRSRWLDATHARVMDRVADLNDVQARVLSALIDMELPDMFDAGSTNPVILVAKELSPSRVVELDPERVLGVATDTGSRTSHSSILARSLNLPCVVGLGDLARRIRSGTELILDGDRGRVVIEPSEEDRIFFHDRVVHAREVAEGLSGMADVEPVTRDGVRIMLFANVELPADADAAAEVNADGVGLFRTEFLAVGRTEVPDEEEQYEAFRRVIERLAPRPVTIRTFDLGGDKFPLFLPPIAEENPFLGWRGVRVYQMMPDLLRLQLRAALRAAAIGEVRLLVPMVSTLDEVWMVRQALEAASAELERDGFEHGHAPLGVMLETPASVAITDILARHVDFFSLGTNDLIQYMLAVDRGNAQLASYFDLYHPAVLRCIGKAVSGAVGRGKPICACGEAASESLGALLLLGLGVHGLSCAPTAILRQKKLITSIDLSRVEKVTRGLLDADTAEDIRQGMLEAFGEELDLSNSDNDSLS